MSDHHVPQPISTTNSIHEDEDDDLNLTIPLKLEFEQSPKAPIPPPRHFEDNEEKQSSIDNLSFCKGLNNPPLAVPMVADTLHNSVTRNDAKQITDSRLKRLKVLSQKPEDTLSKPQKDEKKRIIRLEKNRRAAAMSRRKKKMYVRNLENKNKLMERHIAILEMENAQLRALMTHQQHPHHQMQMNGFPAYKLPVPALSNYRGEMTRSNSAMSESASTTNNSSNVNTSSMNSIEPMDAPPSNKRRKLNGGSSMNTSSSPSCADLSDLDVLEPLPVHSENEKVSVAAPPMRYMPMSMPPAHMHPSRMYRPPPSYIQNMNMMPMNMYPVNPAQSGGGGYQQQQQQKIEGIVLDKEMNESKSEECDEIPPEINIPGLRLSGEFLPMMDEEIIEETVDECGSIIPFECDLKQESKIYL